jgi:protein-tyrosine phosphatase
VDDIWVSVDNFRELGGLSTSCGRRIRPGVLYRSGALNRLSAAECRRLADCGIGTVFDLRSEAETAREPDTLPDGVAYARVGAVQLLDDPSDDPIDLLDWEGFLCRAVADERELERWETFQHSVYPEMASRPDAFRALTRLLLDHPGQPLLFHCTAGKDRTGLAAAIIERLLGVPDDAVIDDYLASGRILRRKNEAMLGAVRAQVSNERVIALVDYMLEVTRAQLESAFERMNEVFGSWDGFVRDGLRLCEDDVATLRDALLVGDDV